MTNRRGPHGTVVKAMFARRICRAPSLGICDIIRRMMKLRVNLLQYMLLSVWSMGVDVVKGMSIATVSAFVDMLFVAGCMTQGHAYHVGNAFFHRGYNCFQPYHYYLSQDNPTYNLVVISRISQDNHQFASVLLPNGESLSLSGVTEQGLESQGFHKRVDQYTSDVVWYVDRGLVEVLFRDACPYEVRAQTGVFLKNGRLIDLPISEHDLREAISPDFVERRTTL